MYTSSIPVWKKLLFVCLWCAFTCFVCAVTEGISMYRLGLIPGPGWPPLPNQSHPVLPDLGFDAIPYFEEGCASDVPTRLVLVALLTTMAYAYFYSPSRSALIRFIFLDSTLTFLRSLTETWTSLNNPNPRCDNCGWAEGCPTSLWQAIYLVLSHFPFHFCGGLMFSGHTVQCLLAAYTWLWYRPKWAILRKVMVPLQVTVSLIGITSLISCRYHYTMDVVVAFWMTSMIWLLYHDSLTRVEALHRSRQLHLLYDSDFQGIRGYLDRLVYYLEQRFALFDDGEGDSAADPSEERKLLAQHSTYRWKSGSTELKQSVLL